MNDADVAKQVQQMVHFIRQEAEEKASEIAVSAEEEFNIHKLQLVEAEKRKIKQEYERKEKQVEVRRKIEYSMQLNQARLKVLQAQDDIVQSLKGTVEKHLQDVSSDHEHYAHLVTQLIVQGLIRLKEPSVLLRCREADLHLVESVVEAAKGQYAEKLQTHPPEIAIDHKICLSAGPKCAGGVVLASKDGKIVLENTLDARLEIVFKNQLPEVRKRLFRSTTLSGA